MRIPFQTWRFRIWPVLGLVLCASPMPAQDPGDLFENVVEALERGYWDRKFRKETLPKLATKFRAAAEGAESLAEECAIVDGLLSHVPSSHLALYSKSTFKGMIEELSSRKRFTFAFQIKQRASRFFACKIFEGGPAERAGLKRGDRILRIDGKLPHGSTRLDRRSDDAYLPDAPLHAVIVRHAKDHDEDEDKIDKVTLLVERRPGEQMSIVVTAAKYSALHAARKSVRVIERGGKRIGYVHFWYIHAGCVALLSKLVKKDFADCDSMVLDLRGRGGNGVEAKRIVSFFTGRRKKWDRPFVALMDRESRSAKEMIAHEFKVQKAGLIIGEKSAGALVPAAFAQVGQGMVLMYPGMRLGRYSDEVELKGVEPDLPVAYPLPYTANADPILDRAVRHLSR